MGPRVNADATEKIILLCHGEPADVAVVRGFVEEYIERRNLPIDLKCCSSFQQILAHGTRREAEDVYLLDVLMPERDGGGTEGPGHARQPGSAIIYRIRCRGLSAEVSSVRAFSYFVKPVTREKLFLGLDKCFSLATRPRLLRQRVAVKTSDGVIPLELERINAVEYYNHRLLFRLSGGDTVQSLYRREPFNQLVDEFLDTGQFVRCAEGYLVNMANIRTVTPTGFCMTDGTEYTVTRKYISAKKVFMDSGRTEI